MLTDVKGFSIEPTNICTLKCPGCARTRFIKQWPQHWKNHSLDIHVLLKFLDIDLVDKEFTLCGNYGDCIYHPDFLNFVAELKKHKVVLRIITNGSYKNTNWWQQLCESLDPKDTVIFSVDGIPDNFLNYRINADWFSIQQGMKICVANGIKTVWKYIPFSFNQDTIQQAKDLSQSLGINEFKLDPSDRYDQKTIDFMPKEQLVGSKYVTKTNWEKTQEFPKLEPQCHDNQRHYISADGFYSPCCFVADHRFYFKTQFGKNKTAYDIRRHTLSQILTRQDTVDFYQSLESHSACQYNCHTIVN
jgi:MoaA/NifB/PqqE/SkfB family radical SAM enzyme